MNDDDKEDSCVLVGTPLANLLKDDQKFTNKPKRQEEQIVTDEKGRQRFHGAFTGGFSAGYFNTVGSKEGWQPSTFKSSRSDKSLANNKFTNKPEDFMDEEDFGDYGIAPRQVSIKSDYKVDSKQDTNQRTNIVYFDDLIKPIRTSLGVKMLRKMGWREGQGVGPKIKRKLRQLKAKAAQNQKGIKTYGVSLPNDNDISDIDEDEDYLVSNYDIHEQKFEIKEDVFGLGYKRLDVEEIFSAKKQPKNQEQSLVANLLFPEMDVTSSKTKKPAIRGQAFGVGDFEDDEDTDIYRQDTMDKYDFNLDDKSKKQLEKSYGFGAFDNDLLILKQFCAIKHKQMPSKQFPPPELPKDFNCVHKLESTQQDSMTSYLKTSSERAELLGESPIQFESVFDLLNQNDREFLQQQKLKQNLSQITKEGKIDTKTTRSQRYEHFISLMKQNKNDAYSLIDTHDLTEWEKENEKEEFYKLYESQTKKLDAFKQVESKFVTSKVLTVEGNEIDDLEVKNKYVPQAKPESQIEKAAREKNYGKLTRIEYEWRPHNTLCKRFNVPNPYPSAIEYGTINLDKKKKPNKNEKFSLFSMLSNESKFERKSDLEPKIITLSDKHDTNNQNTKIEFELKDTQKEDEYQLEVVKEPQEVTRIEKEIENKNVYLQERPEIDIFKSIFEEDDEQEEKRDEIELEYDDTETQINEDIDILPEKDEKTIVAAIPSTIPKIDLNKLQKYLKPDDEDENDEIIKSTNINKDYFDKDEYERLNEKKEFGPAMPVFHSKKKDDDNQAAKLTNIIRSLAPIKRDHDSSDSESSGSIEIIEKSIDNRHKTHRKKKKKHKKSSKTKKKSSK